MLNFKEMWVDKVGSWRRNQYFLLLGLSGFLLIIVLILSYALFITKAEVSPASPLSSSPIVLGVDRVPPQELWVDKLSTQQNLHDKRFENLEQLLNNFIQLHQSSPPNHHPSPEQSAQGISSQEQSAQEASPQEAIIRDNISKGRLLKGKGVEEASLQGGVDLGKVSNLQKVTINLVGHSGGKGLRTHDNQIPAGSFAKVVLLGGVDASTSIQASSDPRPLLLRVVDLGTLPRKFHSDLKGCHVLAACYGDLSSERVFMRLEKLTCMEHKTGEVLEMAVNGYVAGEDGRAGLRGVVVDKAGVIVRNAAIGGFLGGIGNFFSQQHNPLTFAPQLGVAQTNPLTNGELLKQGSAKGLSNALEKYADFYIKRAEQMQPVIQVEAGRVGDIVFTQGVEIPHSKARAVLVKRNDQKRLQQME